MNAKVFGFILALFFLPTLVFADSQQAYQDYLFQSDSYRAANTAFEIAKNEYDKFKTLVSQTTAIEKTRLMLAQRDNMLRAYLLMLNEKVLESRGLGNAERALYQGLISSEVTFLENHAQLVSSVASIEDAERVSKELETHYVILQRSMRQIIIGVSMGELSYAATQYDDTYRKAQSLTAENRGAFSSSKQGIIERWTIQIANKRQLFQQQLDQISRDNASMKGAKVEQLDETFLKLQKDLAEAKAELQEGTSYMKELLEALRYQD